MQRPTLAALIASLFTLPAQAEDIPSLDAIIVTATRIPTADVLAPYASEVHTRRAIEASGAASLYEYLAQHTSVNVMPSSGNRFTPKLDMRGYGIGDGYQNIVVSLDGRRLNNIDMSPQLLGAIPLADIERIEITKGSGSVLFGDGATAGSIQIHTRAREGVSIQASAGNDGALSTAFAAGLRKERVSLSASADYAHLDGYSNPDPSGHRDASSNRTWRGGLEVRPLAGLKLGLDGGSSRIDTRYVSPLTLAQFNADPAQPGSNPWAVPADAYNHQKLESDSWRFSATLDISPAWQLQASHAREDKLSDYGPGWRPNYEYDSDDLSVRYQGETFTLNGGVQTFDGRRIGASDQTGKKNTGFYLQGQYHLATTTLSAGARRENVEYTYTPTPGAASQADHDLDAWDIGVNQRLSERLSLFANYNRAYQAPDIDRFFTWGGGFNAFITPARSRTFNLGINHVSPANRLKLTVFHAKLDHEIYYYSTGPWSGYNTNLDRTHKYGLELQDTWRATDSLGVSLNYAYTRAVIDHEDDGGGAFDGKDLPGVPRHRATLGLAWRLNAASSVNLSHTWRGSAWAAEDFANSLSQRQAVYQSTDVAYRYRHGQLEWFAAVENLFAHKNGMWITDDAIYPVNFTRNWRLGMKAAF